MTRLSCHRFRSNEVRLWLSVIAYNLANLWRRLVLPQRIGNWSLTSLQQRLVKTGGRLIKHARYYWLLLAESHLTRRLFGANAVQDHGAIISSGVGEPPTGADFSDERGRRRKSVGGMGRNRSRFRLWHSQKRQNRPLPWVLEAPNAENPTGHCMEMRSGVCYGSTGKLKRKSRITGETRK
jgi:hypothetical protein